MDNDYGEKLFGNTTNFSPLVIKDFNIAVLKPMFIKLSIALVALFLCLSLYGFLTGILYVGIGMAIMSLIIIPMMIYSYFLSIKKAVKSNKMCSSTTFVDYYFEEGGVRTKTRKGEVEVASLALDYRMITKVVESGHYYHLYVADTQVYILDKNGMTEGSSEKLLEFLKGKVKTIKENNNK